MRLLSKHVDDLISGSRRTINGITGFTETRINSLDSTCKIIETLNLGLAHGCRNHVAVLDKLDANGVFIFSFKKDDFADRIFTLILVYRKQSLIMQEFS